MKLNDEQRTAISHSGDQLLVVAGPGSGKTLVIVERVARLVAEGTPQESILCMTFTEKAASIMRRRLQERSVSRAWVGTMHSLCLEILKENYVKTGITDRPEVFGEMPRLAWCVRNVDKLGINEEVVSLSGDIRRLCKSMMRAVQLAKRELVTADDLERRAKTGMEANPADEESALLAELVKVYRAYDAHKRKNKLIDYDDMVAMVVDLLERDGQALEMYRQRYRHIMVDEFQDHNYAQFRLTRLLACSGSITAVGDNNQSIMGFQGAFGGIFDEFRMAYPEHESVALSSNYRCSGNVSEISSQLLRVDTEREARPLSSVATDGDPVVVAVAPDEAAEREFVAETISKLDVPLDKVAVLCTTNESCQALAAALRARGIPAALVGPSNLVRSPMAAEVMALLRIADSPETSGADISLVLSRRGIREYNIQAINGKAKQIGREPDDGVFSVLDGYSGSDQDTEIREISRQLQRMSTKARNSDLLGTLHRIMMEYTDAYKKSANESGYEAARNLSILNRLYGMADEYERHYYGRRLSDFVEYVELVGDPKMVDPDSDDAEIAGAVSVLTIHKSKGKEFDTVFVTGLYDNNIPRQFRGEKFNIPADLLEGTGRASDSETAHIHEQRNLLYVAMTRAKNRLYLSYPKMAKDARSERQPSRFLNGINYETNPRIRTIAYESSAPAGPVPRDALEAAKLRAQEEACKAIRESRPEAAVRHLVDLARIAHAQDGRGDDFDPMTILKAGLDVAGELPAEPRIPLVDRESLVLSATSIETYQKCPLKFKYQRVLRVPEKPSIYIVKGGIIHGALETLGNQRLAGREPEIDAAIRAAEEKMASVRGAYDDVQYQAVASSIDGIVRNYAKWEVESPNEPVGMEVRFDIFLDGIKYTGRMDRVERNPDGRYEVVDFKTGATPMPKRKVPLDPQLNLYAAAILEKYSSLPIKVSLLYPAKNNNAREYAVTEELLEAGLGVIRECANDILAEKFGATPGSHCMQCPYKNICPAIASK